MAVNNLQDLQTVYRFSYNKDKSTKSAFTDVYNQHNHLSRFRYSTKDYRLTCIEKFKGTSNYTVYCRERLRFGEKGTKEAGDLLFKTLEKSDGTIHFGEYYVYDERGNVLKKNLHFRSFKNSDIHPVTSTAYSLQGGEVKSTFYQYNEINLPTLENDGRLKATMIYYTRNEMPSSLLKSKLYKHNNVNIKREFYDFDKNAGCTLKIEDDGSADVCQDLKDVRIRKITHFINRQDTFAGLPLEIDEWGMNSLTKNRIARTVLNYDAHGYVDQETHYDANNAKAYEIRKIRDIQGNITCETDALGQTTHRKFNTYGSLLEEHGPSPDYFMEYTYDWLQRPVREVRRCTDGIHLKSTKSYDLEGRVTKITNPHGFTTQFAYNEQGRPAEITHPPIRLGPGEWICPTEVKTYNFMGALASEKDAAGAVTTYTSNDAGLPLKITYADKTFETFTYSIYGEVLEKRQRNGAKAVYTYDAFSRQTSESIYGSDGTLLKQSSKKYSGLLLLSETDGEGVITTYKYDYAGRVAHLYTGKTLTKFFYDPLGRVKEEQRYFGEDAKEYTATVYAYDLLGRVTFQREIDASGKVHSKSQTTYDPNGNVTSTTTWNHAGTAISTQTYDPRGNLSSSTDALGNVTYYKQRYDYFFEGFNLPCLEVIDPAGVKTVTVSDGRGSEIKTKIYSAEGKLLSHVEKFYDIRGNLVRKEHRLPTETVVTAYHYDACSRLIKQVNGEGSPEQITTRFIYNAYGELAETRYADKTSKFHLYDGMGRLFEEWSDDKSLHYRYTYNRQDLPTAVENCNTHKKTARKYSKEGNLLSETFENGLKIAYEYDRANRLTKCIYPDGSAVKQIYNPVFMHAIERIKEENVLYTATLSDFDLTGKPKTIQFPKKGGTLALSYDLLDRPIELSSEHYKESAILYDSRGLLTSKTVNGELQKYDHDALGQLSLEHTTQYSHAYENDALYRQTSVDGFQQLHNAVHQLVQGIHGENLFDAKGRRKGSPGIQFIYDPFDRLITINQGDSTWEYTYDAFNRKMSRTYAGETVYYLYDGHEEIGSYDHKQNPYDLKVLAASEGSLPIAIEIGEEHYTPLVSSQGHIVGLVEMETGDLADLSLLTMFGEDLAQQPLSPWRFCGKRHEAAELGLIDFGYRFYHPKSAQWLTQDPLGESDGPNLYAYVNNNPTCYIDRYGLFMDDFSFGNTCYNFGNTVADYTFRSTRFVGATQAFGGLCEVGSGAALAAGGTAATLGIGAAPSIVGGAVVAAHGFDNFATGLHQVWTGKEQTCATVQMLKQAGMSHETASMVNFAAVPGLGLGAKFCADSARLAAGAMVAFNGRVPLNHAAESVAAKQPALIGYTLKILEGNNKWGLAHIMKRHVFGTPDAKASKFLEGMGVREIRELLVQHSQNINSWVVGRHGSVYAIVNTGKVIGNDAKGNPTSLLRISVRNGRLHTAFPN